MPKKKPSNQTKIVPKKDWQWNKSSTGYDGVHTYEGCLTWYTECWPGWAGGGAYQQSFSDFVINGPWVKSVPKDVLDELLELLKDYSE